VINLPAERTKKGHAHLVPLSEPVRANLQAQITFSVAATVRMVSPDGRRPKSRSMRACPICRNGPCMI
jgi:hypothetical protein